MAAPLRTIVALTKRPLLLTGKLGVADILLVTVPVNPTTSEFRT
jgi:hypothetical protein